MSARKDKYTPPAELENVDVDSDSSFHVGVYKNHYFARPWHYHPEFELLLITKGYGTRMVGDHFEPFKKGDLVLFGGNLPHAYISDPHFMRDDNNDTCESVFIQFRQSVFGSHFIDIPELKSLRTVLNKAQRGIKIEGKPKGEIVKSMLNIHKQRPLEQLLSLIRMLDLVQYSDYTVLASQNYVSRQFSFKNNKMRKVHNYIMQNFKEEIDINVCADFIGMTPTSFCRFFKKQTNVTFSVYIHYMRINFAQKLIVNTQMPIKEIGFECGYTSIVYFNQKFKKLTGMSPVELRKKAGKV